MKKSEIKKDKSRLNMRISADLTSFIKSYAKKKNTTITQIVTDHFMSIKDGHVPQC